MPVSDSDEDRLAREKARSVTKERPCEEPMDDEEKVLAGRADANIPALLTKDVPGG